LIDGATGTELERCGLPMINNAWNGAGAMPQIAIVEKAEEGSASRMEHVSDERYQGNIKFEEKDVR